MTHTRIRKFNTKDTYPEQNLDNDLCQAVVAGNTVYLRGQVGTDFEGNLIGLGDPRAQAEQAMKNVRQLLQEAGSDMSHIVKTTTYITDPRFREQMELLMERPEELLERDVVIITDTDPAAMSDIRTKLRPRGFQLTLIGKDGGVKLRKPFPWNVREISRSIDKMPLRQEEIRSKLAGE